MKFSSKSFAIAVCLTVISAISSLPSEAVGQKTKKRANSAMAQITDDPNLPRVLLIGDSISIGYTVGVRKRLAGIANVHRPRTNCGPTTKGIAEIDAWLGDKKWDVIHFNWGLHDLKYMGPNGENLADPTDSQNKQQVPIDDYQRNMEALVARLKKTGAKLIWRSTTPVAPKTKGRVTGDSAKYNAVAAKIMEKHGIAIDDMYTYALAKLSEIQLPTNVHFSKSGSEFLAEKVAESIQSALDQKDNK